MLAVLVIGVVLAGNYFLEKINYEIEKGEDVADIKEIVPVDSSVINILLIGDDKNKKDGERGRQRNVVAGMNHMSGSQALGFARVRYVTSSNGEKDDFGRTNRQRVVLNTIFEECKTKNLVELTAIINDLLPYITTNLSKTKILGYAIAAVGTGMSELETFRIPMDNSYTPERNKSGAVLVVDFEKNNMALKKFIYGAGEDYPQ